MSQQSPHNSNMSPETTGQAPGRTLLIAVGLGYLIGRAFSKD